MTIRNIQKQRILGFGGLLILFYSTILILGTSFGISVKYQNIDSDGDNVPDAVERLNERNVQVTNTPNSVLIQSISNKHSESDLLEYHEHFETRVKSPQN